jgi:hypothetical protein
MASLKKDPEVQALISSAIEKADAAAQKARVALLKKAAQAVKQLAADHASDAKNANNKDGAKRIMDFATDAAEAVKELAA